MSTHLVTQEEFLAIRHSALNGNSYDVGKLVDNELKLEKYTNGRTVVPCFEGDLIQIRETGEVVLTHQNFFQLSKNRYRDLKDRKLAVSLNEVLDKFSIYKQKNKDQKVVLCFEPKAITEKSTIDETVRLLKLYGIENAYFDSFFGRKLDLVDNANQKYGTNYARSLHLIGNVGREKIMMTRSKKICDIVTLPYTLSVGEINEPIIYGAVGSTDILGKISESPNVQGAYVRLKEGAGVKGALVKLWNSVTNTEQLRQTHTS